MTNIIPRNTPANTAVPGLYTCEQFICSQSGCVPTGIELKCINALPNGFDMVYNGVTMECDGSTHPYPLNSCTCTIDYVNCDSNGPASTTPVPTPTVTKSGAPKTAAVFAKKNWATLLAVCACVFVWTA